MRMRGKTANIYIWNLSLTFYRFPAAVTDFRAALAHKLELYPQESTIISEAHFKLSLALEFASITRTNEDGEDGEDADTHVDQGMRDEAAKELEASLESQKLRLQNKEVELASCSSPDDNEVTRAQIAEVKDLVTELEGRVSRLKFCSVIFPDLTSVLACRTESSSS